MRLIRAPQPSLLPFVKTVWLVDNTSAQNPSVEREHVLPCGEMHLVFRLSEHSVRLFSDALDAVGQQWAPQLSAERAQRTTLRMCQSRLVRWAFNFSTVLRGFCLMLLPWTSGSHLRLQDLWGRSADSARERLQEKSIQSGGLTCSSHFWQHDCQKFADYTRQSLWLWTIRRKG